MEENTFMVPETPQEAKPIQKSQFFTFNINTILMLILLVGLAVLYVLFFTEGRGGARSESLPARSGQGLNMVYVNIDTLNEKYQFVLDLKKNLEDHGGKLEKELLGEQAALQKEFNDLQKLIAGNVVTEERANALYQKLLERQQALEEKKNRYTQEVAEKEYVTQMQLMDTIDSFLKRFNGLHGYDYIMGYKAGGEILIANDTLDITSAVLEALNEEYAAHKK